jgi:hypothetical protein
MLHCFSVVPHENVSKTNSNAHTHFLIINGMYANVTECVQALSVQTSIKMAFIYAAYFVPNLECYNLRGGDAFITEKIS